MPHPVHLREDSGSMFGGECSTRSFFCGACSRSFALVATFRNGALSPEELKGPRWCYEGAHSAAPLQASDLRRIIPHSVALEAGPHLQRELDSLPEDTETLSVTSGVFDDSVSFTLNKRLPRLRMLQVIDVCFSQIVLTPETTPDLRTLKLQNVPEDCDLQVVLPELRAVSLQYWMAHGKAHVVDNMLAAATKLESFDSYKLWSNRRLVFASPALRAIDLHRADPLESLSVWAPNLTSLRLQACYSLDVIEFPATHALAATLPAGPACRAPLKVDTANACLGPTAVAALRAHPRVVKSRASHAREPMMATESIFAGMHGGGGGNDGWDDDDDEEDEEEEEEEEEERDVLY